MSGFGEIDVVLPAFAASALSFVFIGFLYMKINAYPTGVNIDMDTRGNPGPKGTLVDELSAQVRETLGSSFTTAVSINSVEL